MRQGQLSRDVRPRLARVFAVYVLRGVAVWTPLICGLLVAEILTATSFVTPAPLWPDSLRSTLVRTGAPALVILVALLLRLGWSLAPVAAAADGFAPIAALWRSWSLVWARGSRLRTVAVAAPVGVLTVGVYVVIQRAAWQFRSEIRSAVLSAGMENPYAAYVVGFLAPIAVAVLLSAAVTLPFAYTAFAALYARLDSGKARPGGAATTAGTA